MPETRLSLQRGPGWALVRMSSGNGLNRLGTETLLELEGMLRRLLSEEGITCLGLSGTGGSFAVGADLNEILALEPPTARDFSDLGNTLFRIIERSEKLVVAAIDGFCLGGGLDLALATDWRLATPRSRFGHPGAELGLITGFGGTQRLPRLVGMKRSLGILFTADRLDGPAAHRMGLVQELCAEDGFQEQVRHRLESFASVPSGVLRDLKARLGWAAR